MEWWEWGLTALGLPALVATGKWLISATVRGIIDGLDERLGLDGLRSNLNPGPGGWPNGSQTLPESVSEVYRRLDETQRSVEALHTDP